MRDFLLRFDDEGAALAALLELHDGDEWRNDVLPVALVTADAVYGEPDGDDAPPVLSPREIVAGFFLLSGEPDLPGNIATIERASGHIVEGDTELAGARLEPAWAGAAPVLSIGEPIETDLPDPADISDRQFAQQLAVLGTITEAEALAWAARGELPATMESAVEELPETDRFAARMLLAAATTYEFRHPLAAELGALLGFDEAARRQLWVDAAAL